LHDIQSFPTRRSSDLLEYILDVQLIFQDPLASLNPKQKLGKIISEALYVHRLLPKAEIAERIDQALLEVGLDPEYKHRLPHQIRSEEHTSELQSRFDI